MKVLVTGANGLVGKRFLKEVTGSNTFPKDAQIYATDIRPNSNLGVFYMDMTNRSMVRYVFDTFGPFDLVYHFAALVGGKPSEKQPHRYISTNVNGTLNILDCMREQDGGKLINMSSWSLFNPTTEMPITEDTKPEPHTPYGTSKLMNDRMIQLYCRNYGIEAVLVRATMIYGEEQEEKNIVQQVVDCMEDGSTFEIWGEGTHTRELLYVGDLVDILIKAGTYKPENNCELFIAGTERPYEIREVVEAGKEIVPFEVKYVPSNKFVFSQSSDMSKIKKKMGINPDNFIKIDEGLRRCYSYRFSNNSS